ncbi:hypothetical protein [Marinimicrobium alkaliphilum]|uniref:hypothetical protein n=1 Tax=Marinimicrobium alkaliphilum TaxID=2202654 RepID=UPI000DBAB600|nr:hypothetical protein [Marinimicrobium alkaliphilum]
MRYLLIVTAALMLSAPLQASEEIPRGALFRYVNDEGVQVISQSIPPQYVGSGYEILSRSGRVIRVVPPAPTEEERAKMQSAERERLEREERERELRRRYSSVADIEAASRRSVAELQGNLSILRGNLNSVRGQIERLETQAANQERSGREVNESVLTNLETLRREERDLERQIDQRRTDIEATRESYEEDIEFFERIQRRR